MEADDYRLRRDGGSEQRPDRENKGDVIRRRVLGAFEPRERAEDTRITTAGTDTVVPARSRHTRGRRREAARGSNVNVHGPGGPGVVGCRRKRGGCGKERD